MDSRLGSEYASEGPGTLFLAHHTGGELKALGTELPVGTESTGTNAYQHRGLGRPRVERAEVRARSAGYDSIRVISAVGTRPFYRALGFERQNPYMAKPLQDNPPIGRS